MPSILGLTLCKINGVFELDVTNAAWDDPRALTQHATGGGVKNATGLEMPNGSFDEVISKSGSTNWRNLSQFSIQIYDKETRKIVVAAFERADWGDLGGSSDTASATTKRKITWKAEQTIAI